MEEPASICAYNTNCQHASSCFAFFPYWLVYVFFLFLFFSYLILLYYLIGLPRFLWYFFPRFSFAYIFVQLFSYSFILLLYFILELFYFLDRVFAICFHFFFAFASLFLYALFFSNFFYLLFIFFHGFCHVLYFVPLVAIGGSPCLPRKTWTCSKRWERADWTKGRRRFGSRWTWPLPTPTCGTRWRIESGTSPTHTLGIGGASTPRTTTRTAWWTGDEEEFVAIGGSRIYNLWAFWAVEFSWVIPFRFCRLLDVGDWFKLFSFFNFLYRIISYRIVSYHIISFIIQYYFILYFGIIL